MSNERLSFLERCWGGKAPSGVFEKRHIEALARLHLMQVCVSMRIYMCVCVFICVCVHVRASVFLCVCV